MRTVMKPIDMIHMNSKNGGPPNPIKFSITGKTGKDIIVSIDRVISVEKEKYAGNEMYRYLCEGTINEKSRQFEIKFELNTLKWFLFRI